MNQQNRRYRMRTSGATSSERGTGSAVAPHKVPRRFRGQAAVLIALAMLLLMAVVGLAIDGGATYQQRRIAQNSTDAAAIAATRVMLDDYLQMVADYPDGDVDGSPESETDILGAITTYATKHGIDPSTLEAYFVDDNKHVVGDGDTLLQVGQFGLVPWTEGAKGIWVKDRAQTNSFFMSLFGWTTVGAKANSTAFMGPAIDTGGELAMLPIGFFTNTVSLGNMHIGQTYTLIDGDSRQGSGNWGYINYNGLGGSGSATINQTWVHCGFNPNTTSATWGQWADSQAALLGNDCADYDGRTGASGPAMVYKCLNADTDPTCSQPESTGTQTTYLKYGSGTNGWWIAGSSGSTNSQCQDLSDMLDGTSGYEFNVPIIDNSSGTGSNIRYHLLSIGRFLVQAASIDCHVPNGGGGGDHAHWHVDGIYEGFYLDGATGHHGDVRHASGTTVFLDN